MQRQLLKEKVLAKANKLFMQIGIKTITMDDVARELSISKKTLYQHFDNKADLINQILDEYLRQEKEHIEQVSQSANDAIDEMLSIGKYIIKQLNTYSPAAIYDLQKYYPESWMLLKSLHQVFIYNVIKTNIDKGIRQGFYRKGINADIIAKLYVSKSSILTDENLFPHQQYSKEKLFKEHIRYHLHGIASSEGLTLLEKYNKKYVL